MLELTYELERDLMIYGNAMIMMTSHGTAHHIPWDKVIKTTKDLNSMMTKENRFLNEEEIDD